MTTLLKLGEKINFNNTALIAVEETSRSCKKCYLYGLPNGDLFCDTIECDSANRPDKKDIILIEDRG